MFNLLNAFKWFHRDINEFLWNSVLKFRFASGGQFNRYDISFKIDSITYFFPTNDWFMCICYLSGPKRACYGVFPLKFENWSMKALAHICTCTIYVNIENNYMKSSFRLYFVRALKNKKRVENINRMKITNKSANTNSCTGTMGKQENRWGKCCIEKMVSEYSLQSIHQKQRERQTQRAREKETKRHRQRWSDLARESEK